MCRNSSCHTSYFFNRVNRRRLSCIIYKSHVYLPLCTVYSYAQALTSSTCITVEFTVKHEEYSSECCSLCCVYIYVRVAKARVITAWNVLLIVQILIHQPVQTFCSSCYHNIIWGHMQGPKEALAGTAIRVTDHITKHRRMECRGNVSD